MARPAPLPWRHFRRRRAHAPSRPGWPGGALGRAPGPPPPPCGRRSHWGPGLASCTPSRGRERTCPRGRVAAEGAGLRGAGAPDGRPVARTQTPRRNARGAEFSRGRGTVTRERRPGEVSGAGNSTETGPEGSRRDRRPEKPRSSPNPLRAARPPPPPRARCSRSCDSSVLGVPRCRDSGNPRRAPVTRSAPRLRFQGGQSPWRSRTPRGLRARRQPRSPDDARPGSWSLPTAGRRWAGSWVSAETLWEPPGTRRPAGPARGRGRLAGEQSARRNTASLSLVDFCMCPDGD